MTIAIIGGMTSLKGHYQDLADLKDVRREHVLCAEGAGGSGGSNRSRRPERSKTSAKRSETEEITIKVIDQAERKVQSTVESSDAVIIITGAVSHQAVKKIKSELCKRKGECRTKKVVYTRSPSMSNISAEVRKLVEGY